MFKPTSAKDVNDYISKLPKERQEIIKILHSLIQKSSTKFKPWFAYNMLGYGKFQYVNYKKEKGEWPIVALASQKNYISLYVCAVDGKKYLAEKYKKDLGRVSVGRSCIRFKKPEDLNILVVKKLLKEASKNPGLISASEHKKK